MKNLKVITQIDRINYFSDNFINYYKNFFHPEEFYFLIHDVNKNLIIPYLQSHGINNFETYYTKSYGRGDNIKKQNEIKKRFINEGYIVLYADQDERIFHPDLRNYIINTLNDWIAPTGIVLLQHDSEPPLDETKKILEQRSWGKLDRYWFSKTCILRKDFEWLPGRHTRPLTLKIDANIYLIDTGKCCKDLMLKNNQESNKIYENVLLRYSTDNENIVKKVFEEHKGSLEKLPQIIKDSLLF
jgi:hypothetical protein